MPAHSELFPWPSYYGHFNFFEDRMMSHDDVKSLERMGNGLYALQRQNGETLRIFICECYAFGVAEYLEAVENFGALDAVIINSAWCGYGPETKRYCRDKRVGLFFIRDFMAALNRNDFWNYLNEGEREQFGMRGWI
ncbi:hypothetical protein [Vogesella alkaliphila]|uniref:Uncharacterized protein n=1 Tax=Vogesella alkaliphila TaxID=1193621 RepID=A0ABQ2YLC4_9NEIS|nr:hypothetical protein [Vogesella alkaliphila]GGX85482.1 hypothetical protein GCM10011290_11400 [Vogesella alkaliphila]